MHAYYSAPGTYTSTGTYTINDWFHSTNRQTNLTQFAFLVDSFISIGTSSNRITLQPQEYSLQEHKPLFLPFLIREKYRSILYHGVIFISVCTVCKFNL